MFTDKHQDPAPKKLISDKSVLTEEAVQSLRTLTGLDGATVHLKQCTSVTYAGYLALMAWQEAVVPPARLRVIVHHPSVWQQLGALRVWEHISIITSFAALPGAQIDLPNSDQTSSDQTNSDQPAGARSGNELRKLRKQCHTHPTR